MQRSQAHLVSQRYSSAGDDTAIVETQGYVPNIVSVMTKKGLSQTSAVVALARESERTLAGWRKGGNGKNWGN